MHAQGQPGFQYFVGIGSLDQVATSEDRVCVLNILGNESRSVTPTSHAYSGGNVVFGTSPGRGGSVLETAAGDIPVFDNVRDGLEAGHAFNTGVVYLPPAAVRHGVYELVRVNPALEKIVIVTEKVPVHDARTIRAVCQQTGVDVFGANCLGVADAWNQVRIGGALGGDAPEEALHRGSVAVLSNSGNFTTTIATYLSMAGWGTTTLISSGKDHYIHFATPEWARAFENDERSRAAVLYVEPGGDYEQGLEFNKPVVACVVGKWKEKLTRPVGHAGAISGSGTSAQDKERWMMETLGVDGIWTPDARVLSRRGAVVTNIAHIPEALTGVMETRGMEPDFDPRGSLALKPWFGNAQGLDLPHRLAIPVATAMEPYREQIRELNRQVGAVLPRQRLKDASGATRMDPETLVSSLHGTPVLDAGLHTFESNLCLALLQRPNGPADDALVRAAVAPFANLHGEPELDAVQAAREAGCAPSVLLSAAVSLVGPARVDRARDAVDVFIDVLERLGIEDARNPDVQPESLQDGAARQGDAADPGPWEALGPAPVPAQGRSRARLMLDALEAHEVQSVPLEILRAVGLELDEDLLLAAVSVTLAWEPLQSRRISRTTARNLPWHFRLYGTMLGAAIPVEEHGEDRLMGVAMAQWAGPRPLVDLVFRALAEQDADEEHRTALHMLLGLLTTNGPGTISAQGTKGAVSADGPESPGRVQLNKAMLGFLSHSGFSHGGNGYEGIRLLLDTFEPTGLKDPGAADPEVEVEALARSFVLDYAERKARARAVGDPVWAIPGINHPVYRGRPVNTEPREAFIHDFFAERGQHNVFHEFYRVLVRVLFEEGVVPNVFAVNIDAVIAALLLGMLWPRYRAGDLDPERLEEAAFMLFLFGRMMGCAAEADDHLNRGRNMDTRTPASDCRHVS